MPVGKRIGLVVQVVVGAGLLALLLTMVDLAQIRALLIGADPAPLVAGLVLLGSISRCARFVSSG